MAARGSAQAADLLQMAGEEPFAMAGLWERWQGRGGQVIESCVIITTDANETVAEAHERMPVILEPSAYGQWLTSMDKAVLTALLRPYPAERMTAYPVSARVNNPANNDVACISY